MKVEELRIGNYVDDVLGDFEAQKIGGIQTTIYDNEWCEVCINWNGADECLRKLHEIKPVPLTEEWLERLGFKKSGEGYAHPKGLRWQNPGIPKGTSGYPNWFSWGVKPVHGIIYVHRLQNLFFALTGEELKMKS